MCEIALAVSGRGLHPRSCPAQQQYLVKGRGSRQRGIAALSDANLILPLDHFLQVFYYENNFQASGGSHSWSKRLNLIQIVNNPAK